MRVSVVIHLLQFLLVLINSFYRVLENWLQGFGFAGRCLAGKNFRSYNLRGCDFSGCDLHGTQLEGVIGGFSWVRPAALVVTIAFSLWASAALPPLPPLAPPEIIQLPDQLGIFLCTLLAITVFLKFLTIFLYSRDLPKRIEPDESSRVSVRKKIGQRMKIVLVVLPSYAAFGCCTFLKTAVSVESFTDKLRLFTLACLFGVFAIGSWMWAVGEMFIFHSSFVAADLSSANLARAKFRRCNFSGARLHSANLTGGDFSYCNFSGADLRFADFRGANLRGAVLKEARVGGAIGLQEALSGSIG